MRLELLVQFIFFLPMMLISLTVHEVAHGWIAYHFGDPTAKLMGRLRLNPIAHIDPFGTILLPIFLILVGAVPLGWAKPVPVNFSYLRNPKSQTIWVAAARPLANLTLATLLAVFIHLNWILSHPLLTEVLTFWATMNIDLAVFNILPLPPLDGSRILLGLLPPKGALVVARLESLGFLFILLLWGTGFFGNTLFPIIRFVAAFLRLPTPS